MTRVDLPRFLGGLAACFLAASTFAPMISASLSEGRTYATSFGAELRILYIAVAVCAVLAIRWRNYWVAAYCGAFGFVNGLLLLVLTVRRLAAGQAQAWARPGWGFVAMIGAGVVLGTLPLWARIFERIDRPSA